MGSSSSTKHQIPKSAYDNLSNRTTEHQFRKSENSYSTTQTSSRPTAQRYITRTQKSSQPTTQHCTVYSPIQQNIAPKLESTIGFEDDFVVKDFSDVRKAEKSNRSQINEHKPHNSTTNINNLPKVVLKVSSNYNNLETIPVSNKIPVATSQPVAVNSKEKSALKSIAKPPNKIENLEDFVRNWNVWKEQVSSFLIITDEKKEKYHQWGSYFLNFMGPFGQEILNELFFTNENDKRNYWILIGKYNTFYQFVTSVKSKDESVIEYIEKLKSKVVLNMKNVDKTLKKKIAKEIEELYKERFIALARSKLPQFKFETTFNSLTLREIAFLWIICEDSNFDSNRNCVCCGKLHQEGKCPAFGKECNKCKRRNHFSKYCPGLAYVYNCSFCGGNHEYRRCLAYGETCSKCGKLHHFSWRCSKHVPLKNCRFCGLSHLMDRNACPAKNSICSICRQRGHYDIKCNEMRNLEE